MTAHLGKLRGRLTVPRAEKIPLLEYQDITRSAPYRSGIGALANRLELPPEDVDRRARACLREMVAGQNKIAIGGWEQFGAYLSRAYEIDIARPHLDEVRRLNQRHSLVFLPSHRSYLDPLVLRSTLLRNGCPPDYVLAGINLSFWPLGPVMRRSGFVFIRRAFPDDEVYKWALRTYLGYLLRNRRNLEWYPEGGRSRTGKLRAPRYGLLTYLAEAFAGAGVDDAYIIPVSIIYDQLYEVGALEAEAGGAPKQPENLPWILDYMRAQGKKRGRVHLAFGEPLSLAGQIGADWATLPPAQPRRAIRKLGIEVMHRIDSVTPVTATGLVTLCLLDLGGRALTVAEIQAALVPLLDYIRRRDLPSVAGPFLDRAGGVRQVLEALVSSGVVTCYDKGTAPVYQVAGNQDLVAAFYRNNIIHFLVNRAVTELVLQAAAEEHYHDPVTDGWREALRLRELLKFEFFFSDKPAYRDEIRSELTLINGQWAGLLRSPDAAAGLLEQTRPHLAHRVLGSYFEAYLVVATRLAARSPQEPVEEKPFLAECLAVARQLLMQQRISTSESLSRELFATGLQLARDRGLTDPGGTQVTERRAAFAREMETLGRRLQRSRVLALSDLSLAVPPPRNPEPSPASPATAAAVPPDSTRGDQP